MNNQAKIKIGVIVILAIMVLLVSVFVFAKPNLVPATNDKLGNSILIPEHAIKVADGVFSLGTAQDIDGRVVEGFLFIDKGKVDKRKANARPVCGNDVCENGENANKCPADCSDVEDTTTTSSCYSLFAKGASWKTTEPYVADSVSGVDLTLTEASLDEWDSEVSFNIFGTGSSGVTDGADDVTPDGVNEVMFENLGSTNTIAYAIVWGIFIGPPSGRELVEWDVVFNSDYAFGDADVSGNSVMDYQNIATHEFGHSLGLAHPGDSCTEETMYAYADFGETKKRTLESGDITGVNKLYS